MVNEALHAPAVYRDALGGAGTTGWDWVIWSFEKPRQYFPNAKLLLNDYDILSSESATTQYLTLINLLNPQSFSAEVTSPANGQALSNVSSVTASATVTYGTAPFTVTFQKKLDSETEPTTVSSDNTALYTADLGNLPAEIYQVRVIVTDSDSATLTSATNTFNVFPQNSLNDLE